MDGQSLESFGQIRDRLSEIADLVKQEDLSLDAALDLYDEAVSLGMKATSLLETVDPADGNPDAS